RGGAVQLFDVVLQACIRCCCPAAAAGLDRVVDEHLETPIAAETRQVHVAGTVEARDEQLCPGASDRAHAKVEPDRARAVLQVQVGVAVGARSPLHQQRGVPRQHAGVEGHAAGGLDQELVGPGAFEHGTRPCVGVRPDEAADVPTRYRAAAARAIRCSRGRARAGALPACPAEIGTRTVGVAATDPAGEAACVIEEAAAHAAVLARGDVVAAARYRAVVAADQVVVAAGQHAPAPDHFVALAAGHHRVALVGGVEVATTDHACNIAGKIAVTAADERQVRTGGIGQPADHGAVAATGVVAAAPANETQVAASRA